MCHFGEKNVLNHCRSPHTFRLSSIAYVGRILVFDAMVFNAVFFYESFLYPFKQTALVIARTCVSQRNYLCLFPESSPIANGVVSDSLLSRLR